MQRLIWKVILNRKTNNWSDWLKWFNNALIRIILIKPTMNKTQCKRTQIQAKTKKNSIKEKMRAASLVFIQHLAKGMVQRLIYLSLAWHKIKTQTQNHCFKKKMSQNKKSTISRFLERAVFGLGLRDSRQSGSILPSTIQTFFEIMAHFIF